MCFSFAIVDESCEEEGAIRVIGTPTPTVLTGYIEVCYMQRWRAVCQSGWDVNAAQVVCRQLGFPVTGK